MFLCGLMQSSFNAQRIVVISERDNILARLSSVLTLDTNDLGLPSSSSGHPRHQFHDIFYLNTTCSVLSVKMCLYIK